MAVETPLKLTQVAIYTLKALDGEKLDLDVELKMTASEQEMKAPGMPAGVKMQLTSMESKGKSDLEMNLSKLASRSTTKIDSSMASAVNMGGAGQAMDMKMKSKSEVRMSPKVPAPAAKTPE